MPDNSVPSVLVTGGKGDLGKAIAEIFSQHGWTVLNPGKAELDVSSEASVEAYFRSISQLNLLINNAGIIGDRLISQMTAATWDEVSSVNLRGAFLCTRAAVEKMRAFRDGHVLFIGSRAARFGTVGQSNYCASKAALIGFSQSLAKEHGPDNLRFNVILPGYLETKMTRGASREARQAALSQHALGRFNTVQEAAKAVHFLASLSHVSGQVFQLDSRLDAWT